MKNKIAEQQKIDAKTLEKLFLRITEGDSEAFQELYELVKGPVYGYSLSILKNHEEATDNTQDVFIKIYQSLDSYQYKQKPMNWIFTITKNLALMKIRKNRKIADEEINENMLISPNITEEEKVIIKILMEKLTSDEREIIIMHLGAGMKHIEIASLLDIKLSTALSKYHRAIKKLRLEWKEV